MIEKSLPCYLVYTQFLNDSSGSLDFTVIKRNSHLLHQCAGERNIIEKTTHQQVDVLVDFTLKTINKQKYLV